MGHGSIRQDWDAFDHGILWNNRFRDNWFRERRYPRFPDGPLQHRRFAEK
jgi:hypothetical protein